MSLLFFLESHWLIVFAKPKPKPKAKPHPYWFGARLYFWSGVVVPPDYVVVNVLVVVTVIVTPPKVVWRMALALALALASAVNSCSAT